MILKGGSWRRDPDTGVWYVYARSPSPLIDGTQIEVIRRDGRGAIITLDGVVGHIPGGYLYRRGKTEALPTKTTSDMDDIDAVLGLDIEGITHPSPATAQSTCCRLVTIDEICARTNERYAHNPELTSK